MSTKLVITPKSGGTTGGNDHLCLLQSLCFTENEIMEQLPCKPRLEACPGGGAHELAAPGGDAWPPLREGLKAAWGEGVPSQ